jgi:hypothetical protein
MNGSIQPAVKIRMAKNSKTERRGFFIMKIHPVHLNISVMIYICFIESPGEEVLRSGGV